MDDNTTENALDLELINIIVKVPANTSRLEITAQYFDDGGKPTKAASVMDASDLFQARKDFLDNVEGGDDYDARYVITEEGRRWLEELRQRGQNCEIGDEDFE